MEVKRYSNQKNETETERILYKLRNEKVKYRILKVKTEYWGWQEESYFGNTWCWEKKSESEVFLDIAREYGYKFIAIDPRVQEGVDRRFGFIAPGCKKFWRNISEYKKKKDS